MYCMSAGFYFLTIFVPLGTFEARFEALSEMTCFVHIFKHRPLL